MTDRLHALFGLDGTRAVVTGGSRGIGRMIAGGLIDAGAEVIISARKADQVAAAAEEMGDRCHGVPADLSTQVGVDTLVEAVRERWDGLDALFNNAGASWGQPVDSFPEGGWDKVMDVNVKSVFFLTQALLPQLRAAASAEKPARVVNTGSINGLFPPAWDTFSYSASKAAVHMLTKHLAKKLADDHITVNAIAPGPFDSQMMSFALDNPESRASIAAGVPLGRVGHPDDMAGVAVYLASRAGSYLTGVVVPVSGGMATVSE